MAVTIADVAQAAGVSKTTVSRVLNTRGEVDASTAARVREVIDRMGYVPSSGAVGLARGSSRTVGMLVPSLTWPWMGEVLQGVVDTVEAADFGLLLFTCNRGAESVARFTSQVSARAFDGLLVVEPENTLEMLTALHRDGLPVVLVDDRGHHPEFPSVTAANTEGGAAAARHLLAGGRRRPLVLTGPARFGCVRDRLAGFRAACAEHGVGLELVVEGDFTEADGRATVRRLLAVRHPQPRPGRRLPRGVEQGHHSVLGAAAVQRRPGRGRGECEPRSTGCAWNRRVDRRPGVSHRGTPGPGDPRAGFTPGIGTAVPESSYVLSALDMRRARFWSRSAVLMSVRPESWRSASSEKRNANAPTREMVAGR